MSLRVLHISDLHASAEQSFDQPRLVGAMLDDAEKLHAGKSIDVVVMSGDLANKGTAAEYELAEGLLLRPLMERLGLTPREIVVIPGNHDVDRALVNEYEEFGLQQLLVDREQVNRLLQAQARVDGASARLAAWFQFHASFYEGHLPIHVGGLAYCHTLSVAGHEVGIAALNSAWRCSSDEDQHRLIIGDFQARSALDQIAGAEIQLVTLHHPGGWLMRADEALLRRELDNRNLVVMTGHEHEADVAQEIHQRTRAVYSRAGCLYDHHEYPNSYTVIDVAPEEQSVTVMLRAWRPKRGVFDTDNELLEGGAVTFPWNPVGAEVAQNHPPYNVVLDSLTEIALKSSVIANHVSAEQASTIEDVLVEPRLLPMPYDEAIAAVRVDREAVPPRADPSEAIHAGKLLILAGDGETGVTSTLLWMLDRQYRLSETHLPVYVPFDRRFDTGSILKALASAARKTGLGDTRKGLPPLIAAIDDVSVSSSRAVSNLVNFAQANPQHKYVLGCREKDAKELIEIARNAGLEVESVYLGPFGQRQLRSLISKVIRTEADEMISQIFAVIRSQDLPRTPFIMAALIAVMLDTDVADPSTFNVSGLLDAYVALLLGSEDLGDSERLGMDKRRREHLLGSLASELTQKGTERMGRLDTEEYMQAWFRAKGWGASASPGGVLNSLIQRRMLIQDDDGVGFRQPALRHLFAAKWIYEDDAFRNFILADCARYGEIIRHAAGYKRSDRQLLQVAWEALQDPLRKLPPNVNEDKYDTLSELGSWPRPGDASRLTEHLELARQVPEKQDPAEADMKMDKFFDQLAADNAADLEAVPGPVQPMDLVHDATELLAAVLRSSELVDDVPLKAETLKSVITGFGLVTVEMTAGPDRTDDLNEFLMAEGVTIEAEAVRELERFVRVIMNMVLTTSVTSALASLHLEHVIRESLSDPDFMKYSVNAMFATLLNSKLHTGNRATGLQKLYDDHGENPLIAETVRIWALMTYQEVRSAPERTGLESLLGNMYTATANVTPRRKAQLKSQVTTSLRKQALRPRPQSGEQGGLDELDVAL